MLPGPGSRISPNTAGTTLNLDEPESLLGKDEEIDFTYADDSATCKLTMDGHHVLTLTVPRGGEGTTEDSEALGYTLIEGVPHSNVFTRGGSGDKTTPGGEGVEIELGDHPIADELRSLGLPDAAPLLSAWTEHMRGSFGASKKL